MQTLGIKLDIDWLKNNTKNIRLHGNKFIQLDIDGSDKDRIHIWSDQLPVAQTYSTQIHNHNFKFKSTILSGHLIEAQYNHFDSIVFTNCETYYAWEARHIDYQNTDLHNTGKKYYVNVFKTYSYLKGDSYERINLGYHATTCIGHAITHMEKFGPVSESNHHLPRVLVPEGKEPDNVFSRYKFSEEYLWALVGQILDRYCK